MKSWADESTSDTSAAARAELPDATLRRFQRLALAAERRDDASAEHTERVARTAVLLADRLGMPSSFLVLLRQAAPLHDIGKLAISDTILLKPGVLTAREMAEVRHHVAAGAAMLSRGTSAVMRMARDIARTHHEWWDGSGYPNGLAADNIPIAGRIVALADVFDALAHARPYKPAWPLDAVVSEIDRLRGSQFDPAIVDAFHSLDPRDLLRPMLWPTRFEPVRMLAG